MSQATKLTKDQNNDLPLFIAVALGIFLGFAFGFVLFVLSINTPLDG